MGRGAGAPLLEERPNHTKQFRHYKFNFSSVSISLECGGSRVPQVTVPYLGLGLLFMECGGSPPLLPAWPLSSNRSSFPSSKKLSSRPECRAFCGT